MKFPTTIPCSEIVWDNILRGNHRWGRRQISLMKIRIDLLQSFNLLPSFWVSINLMTRNLLKRKTIHPDLNLALGLKRASANLVCINLKQKEKIQRQKNHSISQRACMGIFSFLRAWFKKLNYNQFNQFHELLDLKMCQWISVLVTLNWILLKKPLQVRREKINFNFRSLTLICR